MNTARLDQLINATDTQIYSGYIDVIKSCLYGKPKQGYSAFEFSCMVAVSQMFPYELRKFARIISNPSNESLKSTVSKMINNEDFCFQIKDYFEAEACEYEDLKSFLYPLATVIGSYQKKNKFNCQK
jgi:hypothetical protein